MVWKQNAARVLEREKPLKDGVQWQQRLSSTPFKDEKRSFECLQDGSASLQPLSLEKDEREREGRFPASQFEE